MGVEGVGVGVLKLLGVLLGILVVVSMPFSRRRPLRLLGLALLLLVAVGSLAAAVGLVGLAVTTPRSDGFARYGLLFLSVPVGLVAWMAFRFFAFCRDIDPDDPPASPLVVLARLGDRARGRAPRGRERDSAPPRR